MKIGAVIVAFKAAHDIGACLDSCLRFSADLTAGILVIDNASNDSTVSEARRRPGVTVVANPHNRGFAAAVNQGFRHLAGADAVLVLNPDVILLSSPRILADHMERTGAGAAAGLLLGRDGLPQAGFCVRRFPTVAAISFEVLGLNRLFPGNPANRRWRALDFDFSRPAIVEQPPAACLLLRHESWSATGALDEGFYPVWFEDVDFLMRLHGAGWKTVFTPAFSAVHAGGRSFLHIPWGQRQLYWYRSLLRYASLHFAMPGRIAVAGAVIVAMVPRALTGMVTERSTQPLRVCGRVVRLAARILRGGRFD